MGAEQRYRKHLAPILSKDTLKGGSSLKIEKLKWNLKEGPCTEYRKALFGPNPPDIQQSHGLGSLRRAKSHKAGKTFFPNNMTYEEADELLDELARRSEQAHDQAFLSLHCRLRFGEIAALRWGDLRL